MKSIIILIMVCVLFCSINTYSQVPQKISYQGLLTSSSGAPVQDGSYNLKFEIFNLPSGGTLRHSETHNGVQLIQGTFRVTLGPLPAIFSESLYVEVTALAGSPGISSDLTFSPRSELTSAPYSLAPWVSSGNNIFYAQGNVGIGTTSPSKALEISGVGDVLGDGTLPDIGTAVIHDGSTAADDRAALTLQKSFGDWMADDRRIGISFRGGESNMAQHEYGRIVGGRNSGNGGFGYLGFHAGINDNTKTDHVRIMYNGNVGIGTTSPTAKLDVEGNVKVADGTQGSGKVLTSDANGLASWQTPAGGGGHFVGESYGGGIVFFVYDNGQHGLIAATTDQSTGVHWFSDHADIVGATGDGLRAGEMNTTIIVTNQILQYQHGTLAAIVCADASVTVGGINYGDWYLPSKYELNLLYLQKDIVGGFTNNGYWSSTEASFSTAWLQNFGDGSQAADEKARTYYVRAVRSF